MKILVTILSVWFVINWFSLHAQIIISEVADPADNFNARFVELYNSSGSTIDFGSQTWYLSRQANGSTWGDIQLSGTFTAGSLFRVATNSLNFLSAYGFSPEQASGFISGNGDDGYFLYSGGDHAVGTLVDVYGVIDQDGTGEAWEYLDGHAERNVGVSSPNTTWTASEWTITRPANVADMNPNDTHLPVELTSFTAVGSNAQVSLKWMTQSEVDNQGFVLERSREKTGNYRIIASYENDQALRGAGNTSSQQVYSYVDRGLLINGQTYWYKLIDVDVNGVRTEHPVVSAVPHISSAGIDVVDNGDTPKQFALNGNYPNPFNPETTISFDIPETENSLINVNLSVYNMLGQKITTLINEPLAANSYQVKWFGKDKSGNVVPSGIYFYILKTADYISSHKMMLIK